VTPDTHEHQPGFAGSPLSAAQRAEVMAFIDWIRHRDDAP
jgi:hypothetical protein